MREGFAKFVILVISLSDHWVISRTNDLSNQRDVEPTSPYVMSRCKTRTIKHPGFTS